MKKIIFSWVIPMAIAVFILPGCRKLLDCLDHNPGGPSQLCDIQKIIFTDLLDGQPDTLTFTYNRDGSPSRAVRRHPIEGASDWVFSYDRQGRLIQAFPVQGEYTISNGKVSGSGLFVRLYTYDLWNRIRTDTFYTGPTFVNGVMISHHGAGSFSTMEYDSKDRISKETLFDLNDPGLPPVPAGVKNYTYDANGNLVHPGVTVVYDNKVNMNRTNKVWMFFNRDYSVNNPFTAEAYNATGLPTKIRPLPYGFLFENGNMDVQYSCH